jgi:predicted metal-binding membrane protein
MDDLTGAERLAKRSHAITLISLAILTLLAWAWLLQGAGMGMGEMPMDGMAMEWDAERFGIVAAMWWVMMIAMMLPSAAPVILLFARVHRHSGDSPPATPFLAGYLAVWLGFALIAAALHGLLEQSGIVSAGTMALPSGWLPPAFLIAAGLYQLTALKDACLSSCRMPSDFLTCHYRPGRWGALRMGLVHGAYCVGCCWMLMVLLFVGGVMNLAWIAALTLLVAAEKLLPGGPWIARISGAGLILWGVAILIA